MQKSRHDVWVGLFVLIGAAALVFLAVVVLVVQGFLGGADHDGIEGEELTFSVEPGEDLASVARRLDSAGVVASARAFERAAEDSASAASCRDGVARSAP